MFLQYYLMLNQKEKDLSLGVAALICDVNFYFRWNQSYGGNPKGKK